MRRPLLSVKGIRDEKRRKKGLKKLRIGQVKPHEHGRHSSSKISAHVSPTCKDKVQTEYAGIQLKAF
jgi:hypothetical protein